MVPPNGLSFARSGSTWIHWWSAVASANWFTACWVISYRSLRPSSWPIGRARTPSIPLATTAAISVSSQVERGRHEVLQLVLQRAGEQVADRLRSPAARSELLGDLRGVGPQGDPVAARRDGLAPVGLLDELAEAGDRRHHPGQRGWDDGVHRDADLRVLHGPGAHHGDD